MARCGKETEKRPVNRLIRSKRDLIGDGLRRHGALTGDRRKRLVVRGKRDQQRRKRDQ